MRRVLYAFLAYTIIGLISGFYYRELTVAYEFTGETPLKVVHTHTLVLGMFMFLILIGLEKIFKLSSYYVFNWFFIVYNLGVLTSITMMALKGTFIVIGRDVPGTFSGITGLGHVTLTAGFILLFFLLKGAALEKKPAEAKKDA